MSLPFDAPAWTHWENEDQGPSLKNICKFLVLMGTCTAAIGLIYQSSKPLAGVCYATIFILMALSRFELGLAWTFALVPFQQDLGGLPIKVAIAELNLVLLVPVLMVKAGRLPIAWRLVAPSALYLLICIAVSLGKLDSTAIKSIIQMALYLLCAVGVFAYTRNSPNDFYWCFDSLIVVTTVFALIGMVTGFSFLGIHKNGWGASLSLGLVVAFEMWQMATEDRRKKWLLVAVSILTIALVLTVSRGGWMAAAAGIAVLLSLRRDWEALSRLAMVVVPLVAIGWLLLPATMQDYAIGFESKRSNISARWRSIELAMELWQQSPFIGTGVGLRKQYDATNVVLLVLAESGIVGLASFAFVHLNVAQFVWTNHKWLWPNSISFSCVAIGGALVAARLAHGLVDHYWSRGAILAAWAAVGMAVSTVQFEEEQYE